jgi:murein DD-endopeptidase MepM/ murein hydrolase activator NlpD
VISAPILADTYPNALTKEERESSSSSINQISLDLSEYGVQTQVSEKPRDQVIEYTVSEGDTLASIGEKFNVSVDTIRWANNMTNDKLAIHQKIRIPPVTGIVHKVKDGETVYSIAKKYRAEAQNIVNFPFNDFVDIDTFALRTGQTLIVPEGIMPQAPPSPVRPLYPPVNLANGNGQLLWPTGGVITQYPTWYHMAVDIANREGPGIASAQSGTVVVVQYLKYGYGHHVIVDHGNGLQTLYGHMTDIYVQSGDKVSRGQIIGRMGSTGRSTGTHLHFEVRESGRLVNPLPYLK